MLEILIACSSGPTIWIVFGFFIREDPGFRSVKLQTETFLKKDSWSLINHFYLGFLGNPKQAWKAKLEGVLFFGIHVRNFESDCALLLTLILWDVPMFPIKRTVFFSSVTVHKNTVRLIGNIE